MSVTEVTEEVSKILRVNRQDFKPSCNGRIILFSLKNIALGFPKDMGKLLV